MSVRTVGAVVVVMTGLIFSCAAGTTIVRLKSSFDPAENRWIRATGNNTLEGSALLRQRGGTVVTCGGFVVSLFPASSYAEERIRSIYGSASGGYRPAKGAQVKFEPDVPEFHAMMRQTSCDSQGKFRFKELPDGLYYVTAQVTWEVPVGYGVMSNEGGFLARRVELSAGEAQEVVLTSQ